MLVILYYLLRPQGLNQFTAGGIVSSPTHKHKHSLKHSLTPECPAAMS